MEGKKFFSILQMTDKYVNDILRNYRRNAREYKEYVEMWIHEVKVPLTAARLLCGQYKQPERDGFGQNEEWMTDPGKSRNVQMEEYTAGRTPQTGRPFKALPWDDEPWNRRIEADLDRIEAYMEQALYYARSTSLEKDFFVKRLSLSELVSDTLKEYAGELIRVKAAVEFGQLNQEVYGDSKWLSFILRQILSNSVKYRGEEPLRLTFSGVKEKDRVSLTVADNGIGIPEADLDRVFEKGFTGQNGRTAVKSTGIGLYLCKKLCRKMNLEIRAYSSGQGACIAILFPINSMIEEVKAEG